MGEITGCKWRIAPVMEYNKSDEKKTLENHYEGRILNDY
jgi:hypothetical protein